MVSRLQLSASPPELNELLLPAPGLMSEADHVFCCERHRLMVGEFHLQMAPFTQEMPFPKTPGRDTDVWKVPLLTFLPAASSLAWRDAEEKCQPGLKFESGIK